MADWREQYDRMNRWLYRLEHENRDAEVLHDVFFAFVQNCSHLTDWLEHDRSQPIRRTDAKQFVFNSAVLSFCEEVCQGSKHATLEAKKVKAQALTSSIGEVRTIGPSGEEERREVVFYDLFIKWQGTLVSAEEFGRMCVKEWDRLLRAKGPRQT